MLKRLLVLTSIVTLMSAGAVLAQQYDQSQSDQSMQSDQTMQSDQGQESLSVTGTVVSTSEDALTVSTDTGNQDFVVDSSTVEPDSLQVGDRVTIEYRESDNGDLIATDVSLAEEGAASTSATESSFSAESSTSDQSSAAAAPSETDTSASATYTNEQTENDFDAQAGTAQGADADNDQLPATASPMPLVGLIGVFALIVALTAFLVRRQQRA